MAALELDQDHINEAAQWAASQLASTGVARVRLSPGDMTEYRIVIAAPGPEFSWSGARDGAYFWVTLCANFGAGYEWHGGQIDAGYAATKWANASQGKHSRAHIGEVMARFLTATSGARRAQVAADTKAVS